jgi:hypothetical protein
MINRKKRSKDLINKELKENNRKILMIGEYKGMDTNTEFLCLKENCKHIWSPRPNKICNFNRGCPNCAKEINLLSNLEYDNLHLSGTNIERIDDYINNKTPIWFKCTNITCNAKWLISPLHMTIRIKNNDNKMMCCEECKKKFKLESRLKISHKKCRTCKIIKNIDNFYVNSQHYISTNCKDCSCKNSRNWLKNNKEYAKISKKKYSISHRIERNKNQKLRRDTDPIFRLKSILRTGLWNALQGKTKKHSVLRYLKLSIDEFIIIMESKFSPNMTWENIDLDHHIPVSHFDHSDESEIKKCWHWTNFKPMFKSSNRSKQNNLPIDYLENKIIWIDEVIGWKNIS